MIVFGLETERAQRERRESAERAQRERRESAERQRAYLLDLHRQRDGEPTCWISTGRETESLQIGRAHV